MAHSSVNRTDLKKMEKALASALATKKHHAVDIQLSLVRETTVYIRMRKFEIQQVQ